MNKLMEWLSKRKKKIYCIRWSFVSKSNDKIHGKIREYVKAYDKADAWKKIKRAKDCKYMSLEEIEEI